MAVDQVVVRFYDGLPPDKDGVARGVPIGADVVFVAPLNPGESREATLVWTVPLTATEGLTISAEVDPESSVDDANRGNNVITARFSLPDLAVEDLSWSLNAAGVHTIIARVVNQGAIRAVSGPEASATVKLKAGTADSPNALLEEVLPELEPNQFFDVVLRCPADCGGVVPAEIAVVLDEEDAISELNEGNNVETIRNTSPDRIPPQIFSPEEIVAEAIGPGGHSSRSVRPASPVRHRIVPATRRRPRSR